MHLVSRETAPEIAPAANRAGGLLNSGRAEVVFWLSLLLISLAALAVRAKLLHSFPLIPDEGIHLMWLRLLAAGYQPYTEVYITYPPLYPLAIQAVWSMWPTETAQRWFSVGYSLFGALGIAMVARHFAGRATGVAALALTLFSPVLVEPSRQVMGESPSVAWSVWAIWLAWVASEPISQVGRFKQRTWLVLSGLCLATSLLTKLLSPFVVVLIPVLVGVKWWRASKLKTESLKDFKALLVNLLVWGLALMIPALILLPAFKLDSLVQQVVGQRLAARTAAMAAEPVWPLRLEYGRLFWQEDAPLVILGLVGLGWAWWRRHKDNWFIVTWFAVALVMLAFHNPLRYKHYLILIPPLAILGSFALAQWLYYVGLIIDHWRSRTGFARAKANRASTTVAVIGLMLLLGLYLWQIPAALSLWRAKADIPQPPPDEVEALAFIEAVTAPQDCLVSDDMQLLYWSGRMTPPELAEVSTNRLESGVLTTPQLIELTDRYNCQVIATVANRIPKYLPDYMEWVRRTYVGKFHYGEDDIYVAKADTNPRPATPLQADFGGQLRFLGYTLTPSSPQHAGDRVALSLIWQAQIRPATDYAIFVQLRDAANTTLASADYQPYQGVAPTSKWPPGATLQSMTWLHLPPELPPGLYRIYVGLYRPDTLDRVPLQADLSGENALVLGPLEVQ
jgi:4-amino-4-deoxy-L-arabinose transferase-like glycosyltransferase